MMHNNHLHFQDSVLSHVSLLTNIVHSLIRIIVARLKLACIINSYIKCDKNLK